MVKVSEQAEILLALATLAGGTLRLDGGRLDRALMELGDDRPTPLSNLTFSVGSVGLRCFELPEILDMAIYMMSADYGATGDHNVFRSRLRRDEAVEIVFQYGLQPSSFEAAAIRLRELNAR
jgi:hypothetical protein|nr:hypothetical protein [Neorhizobium tomejilense]